MCRYAFLLEGLVGPLVVRRPRSPTRMKAHDFWDEILQAMGPDKNYEDFCI